MVFPRLVPARYGEDFDATILSSGLQAFDDMLHGGIERGTVTLLTGPTGVGKTTLGMQFCNAAARSGHRSAVYTFDERAATLLRRCSSVNIPVHDMVEHGTLRVVELEALHFGPDEFASLSYLADNVIYLRYLERLVQGRSELIRGLGVLKKRLSGFENVARELVISPDGLHIGEPLIGILTPILGRDSVTDAH